jgi:hypothetical protein
MKWDWDYLLHFLGGASIVAITVFASPWWAPFIFALIIEAWGFIREKMQHDWEKLSPHQHIEAHCWGLGGLASALAGLAF